MIRNLIIVSALGLIGAGCSLQASPVLLLGAVQLDANCVATSNGLLGGQVDLAEQRIAQANNINQQVLGQYVIGFNTESSMAGSTTSVSGSDVDTAAAQDFIGRDAVIDYLLFNSTTGGTTSMGIATQHVPVLAIIRSASTGLVTLPAFTPAALNAITAAGFALPAEVIARIHIEGSLRSGTPMSTNTVDFPIDIFDSGTTLTCAAGQTPTAPDTAPCGNIQDGAAIICQ
jgi:hypothetical protein